MAAGGEEEETWSGGGADSEGQKLGSFSYREIEGSEVNSQIHDDNNTLLFQSFFLQRSGCLSNAHTS